MSTELATINQTTGVPAQYTEDLTGLSDIAGIKPTALTLIQPVTRETFGANPGQFLDKKTGIIYDSIQIVPLAVVKNRVLFPPGADLDAEPLCRSNDGLTPSPYAKVPQHSNCKTCPNSQWTKVGGKSVKPPCSEKLKMLVILKEKGVPRFFQVGGVGIPILKDMLSNIFEDTVVNKKKGTPTELFDYFFTLSSEKQITKKGSYYIPRFTDLKRVANPGEFGPLFVEYVVNRKAQVEEEEEAVATEQTANDAVGQVVDAEFVSEV